MAEGEKRVRKPSGPTPIPLEPVDLLAGLAPGVELETDTAPPAAGSEPDSGPMVATVAEVGKLVRAGEEIIRRLIRSPGVRPTEAEDPDEPPLEPDRAGVVPRTRERPGE
jgi:hypothetical protein